jgi:hypothetical protein
VNSFVIGTAVIDTYSKSLDSQTGELAYHKEMEIFDDKLPLVDPLCMPDCQGFTDKDIEALCKPNNRQASRTSPRTPAESALPALVHAANDAAPAPVPDMQASAADDVDETKIAARPGQRRILLTRMESEITILRDGRVYVTLETINGETPALTTQEQGKRLDMPVSRGKDLRDKNL